MKFRLLTIGLLVLVPTVVTCLVLYPWARIPIGAVPNQPINRPLEYQDFLAHVLGIPSAINEYQLHISLDTPHSCVSPFAPYDTATFAEYSMRPNDPLLPYMKQVFATSSCEHLWPNPDKDGIPEYLNGTYAFCLAAGSSVSFMYPANQPVSAQITDPVVMFDGDCPLPPPQRNSPTAPYLHVYAYPPVGELVVGWLGTLFIWIVIIGSCLTLYSFIKKGL